MARKFVFYTILVALVLGCIELSSYIFFTQFQNRFTFVDFTDYLLNEDHLENLSKIYDPELGWSNHYPTPFKERARATKYGRPLISTFGDSYTHCDEVADHETWQTYLSDAVRADVYNFGVGGFGTGQAYLNYRREYKNVNTPIVTLGLLTENINRIVNVYRPFYYSITRLRLTKPRYRQSDELLTLLPNPISRAENLTTLKSPAFLHAIGQNDWWYNKDEYPFLGFPYTKILFNKRLWLETLYGKTKSTIGDNNPRPWEQLWREEKAARLMLGILDAFVADVRRHRASPVILVLPLEADVRLKKNTGKDPVGLAIVKRHCRENSYTCFDAIGALSRSVESLDQVNMLYKGGHVSAKGNKVIAENLYGFLRGAGLVANGKH